MRRTNADARDVLWSALRRWERAVQEDVLWRHAVAQTTRLDFGQNDSNVVASPYDRINAVEAALTTKPIATPRCSMTAIRTAVASSRPELRRAGCFTDTRHSSSANDLLVYMTVNKLACPTDLTAARTTLHDRPQQAQQFVVDFQQQARARARHHARVCARHHSRDHPRFFSGDLAFRSTKQTNFLIII